MFFDYYLPVLCYHIGTKGYTVPSVIYEICASFVVCQNRGMFALKPRGTILDHLPYIERFHNIAKGGQLHPTAPL